MRDAKEFFDYSWAEIGQYDTPANLNFVKEHSPGKQVIYIGFGEGSTAILYGLSQKAEAMYFKHFLDDVVLLAPCLYLREPQY